jgi:hypothetical protein
MGEAMLKGKKVWTKWVAARMGFTGKEWAPDWMSELAKCGLPGPDYIVRAPNIGLTAWLKRPAEYRDFARAYHLLLMVYGGESPSSVVEYTPHGCRHVQVTAGAQLAAQGIISEQSLESLGQWERGSKMPKSYDAASCVSELQTRKVIADTLLTGWRPAMDGNLPLPPTPARQSSVPLTPTTMVRSDVTEEAVAVPSLAPEVDPLTTQTTAGVVVNTRRNMAHRVLPNSIKSTCSWFTCGTKIAPRPGAVFGKIGKAKKCRACFGT